MCSSSGRRSRAQLRVVILSYSKLKGTSVYGTPHTQRILPTVWSSLPRLRAVGVIVHFIVKVRTLILGMGVCNNWSERIKLYALAFHDPHGRHHVVVVEYTCPQEGHKIGSLFCCFSRS